MTDNLANKFVLISFICLFAISAHAEEKSGENIMKNGFQDYGHSGMCFRKPTPDICAWNTSPDEPDHGDKPDLIAAVSNPKDDPEKQRMQIFVTHYKHPFEDKDHPEGGIEADVFGQIRRIDLDNYELSGANCPKVDLAAEYNPYTAYHWQEVKKGDIFCLLTRHGYKYALIEIKEVGPKGLRFKWRYNPDGSSYFPRPEEPGAPEPSKSEPNLILR